MPSNTRTSNSSQEHSSRYTFNVICILCPNFASRGMVHASHYLNPKLDPCMSNYLKLRPNPYT